MKAITHKAQVSISRNAATITIVTALTFLVIFIITNIVTHGIPNI